MWNTFEEIVRSHIFKLFLFLFYSARELFVINRFLSRQNTFHKFIRGSKEAIYVARKWFVYRFGSGFDWKSKITASLYWFDIYFTKTDTSQGKWILLLKNIELAQITVLRERTIAMCILNRNKIVCDVCVE